LATSIIEQTGFAINDENSYASGKLKRPRGPRSSLTLMRPQFDLETRALDYFFLHHVVRTDDLSEEIPDVAQGLCGCTATWKSSGRKSVMVDKALACVSMAVYARTRQCPIIAVDASAQYGQLLRMMQEKVKNILHVSKSIEMLEGVEGEECIDAYLLTMLIMGRYESTMHSYSSIQTLYEVTPSLQRWIHHEGALTILKRWSEEDLNLRSCAPTTIIKLARRGMIQSSLRQNVPLQDWIVDGSRFGERDLGLEYDRILVATVDLYQQVDRIHRCDSLTDSTVLGLIKDARAIDIALQVWASKFPDAWAIRRQAFSARPLRFKSQEENYYPSMILNFDKPGYAAVWIQYFATRMLVNSTCLTVFNLLSGLQSLDSSFLEEQRLECSQQLRSTADSMASAVVAFSLLGKVSRKNGTLQPPLVSYNEESASVQVKPSVAGLIVWPLAVAASVAGVEPRQQKWFRSELARIGKLVGNGFFELAASSAEWTILGGSSYRSLVDTD
jgi:hypothetical protein